MRERNYTDELYHYGVKGQKWGVRRFQKKDGTLTLQGKNRYNRDVTSEIKAKKPKVATDGGIHKPHEKFKTIEDILKDTSKKNRQIRRETTINELSKKSKLIEYGSKFVKLITSADPTKR